MYKALDHMDYTNIKTWHIINMYVSLKRLQHRKKIWLDELNIVHSNIYDVSWQL